MRSIDRRMDLLGSKNSFFIVNLGCKVNRAEADSIASSLISGGLSRGDLKSSDLVVVNTCTVTGEAEKKARKAVRHALFENPYAQVVVTGCAAAIDSETFMAMGDRVLVVGRIELLQWAQGLAGGKTALRIGAGFNTRVQIKIQDGCDHACTYCIVHVARGPAKSTPVAKVLQEARAHFDAGVREIVLTGIDAGSYSSNGCSLARLARLLVVQADESAIAGKLEGHPARIRLSSIEPQSIDDELVEAMVQASGRICRHLHVPLQSGSSKVLKEMGRLYTAEEFADEIDFIRKSIPEIALSTDIIVGFPGETERDFKETCDLAREAGFSRIHVFPYSKREGTPAAERSDQIDPETKRERAAELRDIARMLEEADKEKRMGTAELALVEGACALTESYHEVKAPSSACPGSLVEYRFE